MDRQAVNSQVCITGANGFIGKSLDRYLRQHGITTFHWNRSNPLDLNGCKMIVHLAARVHQMNDSAVNPESEYRRGNRDLTVNLAKQALEQEVEKFIFISSVKVIGESPGKYDINVSCNPADLYGISKKEAEDELCELFAGVNNSKCIVIRLPMVYGPGNKGNMLSLLKAASKHCILPLGSANAKRSMINVDNVCDAILKILNDNGSSRSSYTTYFLSDNRDLSSRELYSLIYKNMHNGSGVFPFPEPFFRFLGAAGSIMEKVFQKKFPLNKDVVSRLFDEYRFSSSEFCKDYTWNPVITPEEGIKKTVEWYSQIN